MKAMLLMFLLAAMTPPQEPRVLPSHTHGPHANEPLAKCWRGPDESRSDGREFYKCSCALICEGIDQREADDCVTSCGTGQCLCHVDEACDVPQIQEPKR